MELPPQAVQEVVLLPLGLNLAFSPTPRSFRFLGFSGWGRLLRVSDIWTVDQNLVAHFWSIVQRRGRHHTTDVRHNGRPVSSGVCTARASSSCYGVTWPTSAVWRVPRSERCWAGWNTAQKNYPTWGRLSLKRTVTTLLDTGDHVAFTVSVTEARRGPCISVRIFYPSFPTDKIDFVCASCSNIFIYLLILRFWWIRRCWLAYLNV
jgi:hypothetical protein